MVTAGDETLLIDCGTDLMPGEANLSDRKVSKILLTHFHRDQCSSANAWQQERFPITVPFVERLFLEESDLRRAGYDIYNNYESFYDCFGPLKDIRADEYAFDYSNIAWQEMTFEVVPLPGHTFGSVGYLFEVDGKRVLACGDLLSGPEMLHNYFSNQWAYMDFVGHSHLIDSLRKVDAMDLDLILPGHGQPFEADTDSLARIRGRIERTYEMFFGRAYEEFRPVFRQLTDQVFEITNAMARTYIIRDDDGHAVMIDSGYVSNMPIQSNPHRYIDNLTHFLEPELGIREVEWFLPTHYHDDHLAGYPVLKNRYDTKVVSSPEVKDILEHPERYDMPCAVPEGMKVHHVVERGDAFEWRGIKFFIEQHPGQTLYHHIIYFECDGQKFLSIGDNISGISLKEGRELVHSFIPKNRTPVSSYLDMPQQILERSPDWVLTGHCGALEYDEPQLQRWREWMGEWHEHFAALIDQPHANMGMDPHWVEFYPYKIRIQPGDEVRFSLNITNHEPETCRCEIRFRSVDGVVIDPIAVEVNVDPGTSKACELKVRFPESFQTHSLTILADVTWNGRRLGEIAEAVAYW
jgi:glyoxylase-like metal-dependent hydrolase (beta-lactamase superfamily II)